MSKLYRYMYVLVAMSLSLSACSGLAVRAQKPEINTINYIDLLGKSLRDESARKLLSNHCTDATQVRLCKEAGVAVWLDTNQIVKEVYLYLNNDQGFSPYQGELPLGLRFYDTLGAVEYKLRRLKVNNTPMRGNNQIKYEGRSPDHLHYWVTYQPYRFTIIYNAPILDEDATIYAILFHS
ncbi:MAG TPA: hypothetical protein VFG81_18095 [Anaerolineales bacterium]|jgi:hypothetical protein|nr:hypothetical protein [Anaerolineales bacterium]